MITAEVVRERFVLDETTGVFTWRVQVANNRKVGSVAGTVDGAGYVSIGTCGRYYKAHRLVWLYVHGVWPKNQIDHINGVRTDNRPSNLRDVTKSVNLQNQKRAHANSAHGFLGVRIEARWNTPPRYLARITVNGHRRSLGTFGTAEEAHAAYLNAKRVEHPGCTI